MCKGEPLCTAEQDDAKNKLPNVNKFLAHGPGNYQETDVHMPWNTWSIQIFFTCPTDIPGQQIDESTHGALF